MTNNRRKKSGFRGWSMFPALHHTVDALLAEDGLSFSFHNDDTDLGVSKDWDTNIMGRFRCQNPKCSSGWSSKKIAITIRMYPDHRYNARVYHQRCNDCNTTCRPHVDDSYADRVAYRLKVWLGISMTPPPHGNEKSKAPHRRDLCEGCKAGHCEEK
ncbi:zinc-binding domain-containing protein [Plectosphaerella cucumerina]|uniref:Zinc-binding domain-containing protein n=1 Tax=Plectosphaerella cucumerina TaxID=40658 RepID=A0A8K0T9V5_9PEZI|nr:zinc-binding domain-containing protein [Plectosphaerella cucumerina]